MKAYACLGLMLVLIGCRGPQVTTTPPEALSPTASFTRTAFVLPSPLPTATPRPTATPAATLPPPATATITATRPPASPTPTADALAATPTLDAQSIYELAGARCAAAFDPTQPITTSQSTSNHLPTFILINPAYDSYFWQPSSGFEWIEAENSGDVRSIACIQENRRQDAVYGDQTVGYSLLWDVRLLTWPEGELLAEDSFWGAGPTLQKRAASDEYGTPPLTDLLTWLLCDLPTPSAQASCVSGGPLAFSPDGQNLVAGSSVWQVGSAYAPIRYLGHEDPVQVLAASPQTDRIASSSGDRQIHLWDSGSASPRIDWQAHRGAVTALAFSPDGSWLLSASQDGSIRLWEGERGQAKALLGEGYGWLHAAAISPDGRLAAAATWGQPGYIYVWDFQAVLNSPETQAPIQTIEAGPLYVNALAFSPDSSLLASASLDGEIKLWDAVNALESGAGMRLVGLLNEHSDSVTHLAFSPDGASLASGSADRSVLIWDVPSGTARRILPGAPQAISGLAYSPDGTWLAVSSDGLIRLWPSP